MIVSRTFLKKELHYERSKIEKAGDVIKTIFGLNPDATAPSDEMSGLDQFQEENLESIIKAVLTGVLDNKLLSHSREKLGELFDFFDIEFYKDSVDFPDKILKGVFYLLWYRHQITVAETLVDKSTTLFTRKIKTRNIDTEHCLSLARRIVHQNLFPSINSDSTIGSRSRNSILNSRNSLGEYQANLVEPGQHRHSKITPLFCVDPLKTYEENAISYIIYASSSAVLGVDCVRGNFATQLGIPSSSSEKEVLDQFSRLFFREGKVVVAGKWVAEFLLDFTLATSFDLFFINANEKEIGDSIQWFFDFLQSFNQQGNIFVVKQEENILICSKSVPAIYRFFTRPFYSNQHLLCSFSTTLDQVLFDGTQFISTKLGRWSHKFQTNYSIATIQTQGSVQSMANRYITNLVSIYVPEGFQKKYFGLFKEDTRSYQNQHGIGQLINLVSGRETIDVSPTSIFVDLFGFANSVDTGSFENWFSVTNYQNIFSDHFVVNTSFCDHYRIEDGRSPAFPNKCQWYSELIEKKPRRLKKALDKTMFPIDFLPKHLVYRPYRSFDDIRLEKWRDYKSHYIVEIVGLVMYLEWEKKMGSEAGQLIVESLKNKHIQLAVVDALKKTRKQDRLTTGSLWSILFFKFCSIGLGDVALVNGVSMTLLDHLFETKSNKSQRTFVKSITASEIMENRYKSFYINDIIATLLRC